MLVVEAVEAVDEVGVVEVPVLVLEEEVAVLRAELVEVKEAPHIHEYAFCVFNNI